MSTPPKQEPIPASSGVSTVTPPEEQSHHRRRIWIFAVFWSAILFAIIAIFRQSTTPVILGTLIAYVFSPLVRRLTKVKINGKSAPRWTIVLGLYIVIIATLATTVRIIVPVVASEARSFAREGYPKLRDQALHQWLPKVQQFFERWRSTPQQRDDSDREDTITHNPNSTQPAEQTSATAQAENTASATIVRITPDRESPGSYRVELPRSGIVIEEESENRFRLVPARNTEENHPVQTLLAKAREVVAGHTFDIVRIANSFTGALIGGIFRFFITLMLSAYILLHEEEIFGFFRSMVSPGTRPSFDMLVRRIDRGLSGVVRGQLVICAVNGVFSAVGFAIAKLPYWPLLALIAAVLSLIPIFGSILSSIPAVAIGLQQGIGQALFVLGWIVGIHQVEANVLNPKIMGDAAKINPVLVVFSLLAGEHFFGILGALLAVPTMSIVQSIFLHWRQYALRYADDEMVVANETQPTKEESTDGANH